MFGFNAFEEKIIQWENREKFAQHIIKMCTYWQERKAQAMIDYMKNDLKCLLAYRFMTVKEYEIARTILETKKEKDNASMLASNL